MFAEFLERIEGDEPVDFEALCAEHRALAPALRRLHVRWQAMTSAFGELSTSTGTPATAASSPSIVALMTRRGGRGARMARYAIGPEFARGAMGRVVQAWDEELRREVALKIHRGSGADVRMRRRFLEEAQIAAQLDHPGIVPIHELGLDEAGRPFFSMQLVRGRDLGAILALVREGKEDWSRTRVLHVLLRVCEAMAFAHSKGVVHRDLKPANIMVGRFGETYVMDWGLAHVAGAGEHSDDHGDVDTLRGQIEGEDDVSPLLTHHGDVIGTPAYMAPEQATGTSAAADPAVDIYALGAILYHLLAGHMPYGESGTPGVDALLQRVRSLPPPPLGYEATPELRAICERAMAREPRDRYPDIAALGEDLRAFLEVRTVRAYATGRFADLRKWIARNRALTATFLAFLLALTSGAIAVTAFWLRAESDRERADAGALRLQTELDRSAFRSARQALQLDDSAEAGDALWRAHFAGRMPRATAWALAELTEHDPYLLTLPIHEDYRPVAFAKGVGAVLVGGADGRLQVRDGDTLAVRCELGVVGPSITSVAAGPDRKWALAGNAKGELLVWDLEQQRELRRVMAHTDNLRCIAMGQGDTFATGGGDGRVLWWSGPAAEPRRLLQHDDRICSLVVTPENDGAMAGDIAGTISGRALDDSWKLKFRVGGQVTALACGSRSSELWVGSTDHLLRFYDFSDNQRNRSQPTRNGTCRELARDTDGSMFAGGWWRTDRVAADGSSRPAAALRGISRFAFDADRRLLLTSGATCGLGFVDVSTRDRRHIAGGTSVALSHDGRRFATVIDNRVVVSDVDSDAVVCRLEEGRTGWLRLDPTGALVMVMSGREGHVFETDTGKLRFTTSGPADNPFGGACDFSPDGQELAVCTGADRIRRVRCRDGHQLADYAFPGLRTIHVVYSPDGARVAAIGRDDGVVRIWHLADGRREDIEFDRLLPTGVQVSLSAVALSPDGERIAVGTWHGGIVVRERDGRTTSIPAHAGTIWSLQFVANDPGLLVSSGGSSGISFWDLDTNECCYQTVRDVAGQVQVSNDGRTLACQLTDGVLLLDLSYRERHIAGNLAYHLERQRGRVAIPPAREQELHAWAAKVLAQPWPRWESRR